MAKQLVVELTDEQYARYKAGYTKLQNLEEEATDEQLIAQLKREASAITYAAEVDRTVEGSDEGWSF